MQPINQSNHKGETTMTNTILSNKEKEILLTHDNKRNLHIIKNRDL